MDARSATKVRDVTGIVLLDKPPGMTSNRALQHVKRLFRAVKAGHTGSLDPLATGMLPICLGEATKVSGMLLDATKSYRVTAQLGVATDTGDAEGTVIERRRAPALERTTVRSALDAFRGEIEQVPPMFSALKHRGRRLYELARRGEEVARAPRRVEILAIELEGVAGPEITFRVDCSKGTYVRSLVTDVAARLGTVGHVTGLRRLAVTPYTESEMVGFTELEERAAAGFERLDATLLPADGALSAWPSVELDVEAAGRLRQGQWLRFEEPGRRGPVRLYDEDGRFLGVGEVLQTGELRPRRLFVG